MPKPYKFGKYQLLERIAVGGMAEVFVAKAFGVEGFERLLAIKKILPTMGEDAEFISMFVDEARIAVQLAHANIVQVMELGKHDDNLYIAMEYISGRDLRQIVEHFRKEQRKLPVPQACAMVAKICEALDYAHQKRDARGVRLGIVHRDVSPQNVLVSYEGEVKLIDFGIAKAESRLQKTQAGILKGKFAYMSPEQVRGLAIDGRSDVFACGILLWELLAGEKLFTGESDFAVLEKIRNGVVPKLPRTLPEGLDRVLDKALHVEAAQRYQRASDLHDALTPFAAAMGTRQLGQWMHEEFQADFEKEQARLRTWMTVKLEDPGLRRRQAEAFATARMTAGDFAITPQDPFPISLVQSVLEARREAPRHRDVAAGHELPTMKMEGDELVRAERALAVKAVEDRTPSPNTTQVLPVPAPEAAAFDLSTERTGARRIRRDSAMARPARAGRTRKQRLLVAVPGILVAAATVAALLFPGDGRPGKVIVTPSVNGELWIDGKAAGSLPPFVHTVPAGEHRLEVRAEGYKPFTATVTVKAGQPVEIAAPLQANQPLEVEGVVLTQPKLSRPGP